MKYVSPLKICLYALTKEYSQSDVQQVSFSNGLKLFITGNTRYPLDARIRTVGGSNSAAIYYNDALISLEQADQLLSGESLTCTVYHNDGTVLSLPVVFCLRQTAYLDSNFTYEQLSLPLESGPATIYSHSVAWFYIRSAQGALLCPSVKGGAQLATLGRIKGTTSYICTILPNFGFVQVEETVNQNLDIPGDNKNLQKPASGVPQSAVLDANGVTEKPPIPQTSDALPNGDSAFEATRLGIDWGLPLQYGNRVGPYYPLQTGAKWQGLTLQKEDSFKLFSVWYYLNAVLRLSQLAFVDQNWVDKNFLGYSPSITRDRMAAQLVRLASLYASNQSELSFFDVDQIYQSAEFNYFMQLAPLRANHIRVLMESGCHAFSITGAVCAYYQDRGFNCSLMYAYIFEQVALQLLYSRENPNFVASLSDSENTLSASLSYIPNILKVRLPVFYTRQGAKALIDQDSRNTGVLQLELQSDVMSLNTFYRKNVGGIGTLGFKGLKDLHFVAFRRTNNLEILYDSIGRDEYVLRDEGVDRQVRLLRITEKVLDIETSYNFFGDYSNSAMFKEGYYWLPILIAETIRSKLKRKWVVPFGSSETLQSSQDPGAYKRLSIPFPLSFLQETDGTHTYPVPFRPVTSNYDASFDVIFDGMSSISFAAGASIPNYGFKRKFGLTLFVDPGKEFDNFEHITAQDALVYAFSTTRGLLKPPALAAIERKNFSHKLTISLWLGRYTMSEYSPASKVTIKPTVTSTLDLVGQALNMLNQDPTTLTLLSDSAAYRRTTKVIAEFNSNGGLSIDSEQPVSVDSSSGVIFNF